MTRSREIRTALLVAALLAALPVMAESQAERINDQRQHGMRLNQGEDPVKEIEKLPAPAAGMAVTPSQTERDTRLASQRKYEDFGPN